MKKNINAALKTVFFESINRGTKKTEYREMSQYWIEKIVDFSHYPGKSWEEIRNILVAGGKLYWNKYKTITFFNNNRHITMEIKDIITADHHTSFAIKLGKRVNENVNIYE